VKLDMLIREEDELTEVVEKCRMYPDIKLVAERVETEDHLTLAERLGFELLQGYAVGRPQVLSAVALSPSRLRRLELLGQLSAEDADIPKVVSIVSADPALSFRVLRATNSASAGLLRKVSSVRDAVVLLGCDRVRQWVALMLVSDIAETANEDQLSTTMARAKLCQLVAERLGLSGEAAFTVGLLAGVADLIAEPIGELVSRLPLTVEVTEALVDGHGRLGEVLSIVKAYELTDSATLSELATSPLDLAKAYLSALGWSMHTVNEAMNGDREPG
jgi:EAL and modified HD-GYP domain-containing signal transduction protein